MFIGKTAFAQNLSRPSGSPGIDTILKKIATEKDEYKRFDLIMGVYAETFDSNPELTLLNLPPGQPAVNIPAAGSSGEKIISNWKV